MPGKYWRAESGFFLGIWVALMIAGRSQLFHDPGTFWHTVLGQRMLSSGRLIETDPFSFPYGGTPWIPHSWLTECLMAAVHRISGLDGLLLVTATVLACLYTWTAHRFLRSGLHWLPTALLVALALAASATHFHVRPHIATIVGLGITYGRLSDVESGRGGLGRLFWLIPLFVVWSNLHGGMPAGLATLGLVVVGWGCFWLVGWNSPVTGLRQLIALGFLILACGLTCLVNPYGLRLPQTWLAILGSPVLPRIIMEHAPPSPQRGEFWMIVLLGLTYVAVLAGTWPRRPRVTWLVPLVWFVLALSRVRNAPLFAITAVVALADLLPHSRLAPWLARPGRDLFRAPAPESKPHGRRDWRPMALPLALLFLAVTLQGMGLRAPVLGRGWARLNPADWPIDLLPDLQRIEHEHPEGARIFNNVALGGFLIYHAPGLKVFIDDRCELYGDDWLLQFWDAQTQDPARLDEWSARYRIPYALIPTGSPFDSYLAHSPEWFLIRRGPTAALYQRDIVKETNGQIGWPPSSRQSPG